MILSASKQLEMYRKTFSRLIALTRKYPDAKISDIVKSNFNEITGTTALELKEPVAHEAETASAQVTGDVPTVQASHQEV
jgi:hypothetical protein